MWGPVGRATSELTKLPNGPLPHLLRSSFKGAARHAGARAWCSGAAS